VLLKLCSIAGRSPAERLTLRELVSLAEETGRQKWHHTSTLLALIANCHSDSKKTRRYRPEDFNPYAPRRARGLPITPDNIEVLKLIFCDPAEEIVA
jgi:hypothetical protein